MLLGVPVGGQEPVPPVQTATKSAAAPDAETVAPAPVMQEEQWELRLEELREGLLSGEQGTDEVELPFGKLEAVLVGKRQELREALAAVERGADHEEALALHTTLHELYDVRLALLELVSPEFRGRLLGTGRTGTRAFKAEVDHVALEWRFQRALMREQAADSWEQMRQAPLRAAGAAVRMILVVVVLGLWFNWSRVGLPGLRARLLEMRPRTQRRLRFARFIWYIEQVRHPLGWLVFFEVLLGIPNVPLLEGPLERVSSVFRWVLLLWLAIRLLNALAARDKSGLSSTSARLRLRSLRLVAGWVLLLGLGLGIAEAYAGRGALHAWVGLSMKTLGVLLLLLLVTWWRPTIYLQLEQMSLGSNEAHALLSNRKGLRGFFGAAVGGVYLLFREGAMAVIEWVAKRNWGRGLRSQLYRMALTSRAGHDAYPDLAPLPDELRDRLVAPSAEIIERTGRPELRRLIDLARDGSGGMVAVVADRGFGKSILLKRLAGELDQNMLCVDCPPGGLNPLLQAFARELGLDEDKVTLESIGQQLTEEEYQVVAVDGYHHMVRPVMGALLEFDRLSELEALVHRPILWVVSLNLAAWNYVSCARGSTIALTELLQLPPWPEELIGRLIESRCRSAAIEPDFSRIRLPRLLAEGEYDSMEERNRAGVYRLVQDIAQGSPAAAIRIWADSLVVAPDGTVVVQLPDLPALGALETGSFEHLLVLRVLLQCNVATEEDLVASLRLRTLEIGSAVRYLAQGGWIEETDGGYRITDRRYAEVVRALNRRNLINTSIGVGVL